MKLKDITIGNYYLTKGDSYCPPQPVKALEIVEVKSGESWRHYGPQSYMKKIKVADIRIDNLGKVVEVEAYTPLVPGRIQEEISGAKAVGLVAARAKRRNETEADNKAADESGARFMSALIEAGFGSPTQTYKGVTFSNKTIATWARANPAAK